MINVTDSAALDHAELTTLLKLICSDLNAVTGGESGLSATAYADLVAAKTSLDTGKTAIDELIDDHAVIKTSTDELIDDHATFKTVVDDIKALVNDIRLKLLGDYVDGPVGLVIGTTPENVGNIAFDFHVNGIEYHKDADAVGVALSGDDVPLSLAGGWGIDINSSGTLTIAPAPDNVTGYATELLARAAIPAGAVDTVRIGTVTVLNTGAGAFDPGTTALDAVTVSSATFMDATPLLSTLGSAVTSSTPATLSAAKLATLTASKPTAMAAITTVGS